MRPVRHLLSALLCATALATCVAGPAAATVPQEATPAPAAGLRLPRAEPGRVVVRFDRRASARVRARALAAARGRRVGGLAAINVDVVETPDVRGAISALSARREVLSARPEVIAQRLTQLSTPERTEIQVGPARVAAGIAFEGAGTRVAVIDDGVWRTTDLGFAGDTNGIDIANRLLNGGNCSDGDCDACLSRCSLANANTGINSTAFSAGAHGTAVATIVAARNNTRGIVGVAPRATIVSYRVFASLDEGASDLAISAAILEAAEDNVDVINLSLGTPLDSEIIRAAIEAARASDPRLVIVAAAGNDGAERASYPAGNPGVLSVGSSQCLLSTSSPTTSCNPGDRWRVAAASTAGDVDVLAPGVNVRAWHASGTKVPVNPETETCTATAVTCLSGTSYAAPQVTGMVAALAGIGVRGDQARAAIVASARRVTDLGGRSRVASGYGRADALGAYNLAVGTAAYSAAFFERGAFVPRAVGHRRVEVIRVDPLPGVGVDGPATLLVDPDDGRAVRVTGDLGTPGALPAVHRVIYHYYAPRVHSGPDLQLLVGAPGEARTPVSVSLLDPTGGPEGKPVGTALPRTTTRLTYGVASSVLYEIALTEGQRLRLDYEYAAGSVESLVEVWLPDAETGGLGASDESFRWDGDEYDGPDAGTLPDDPEPFDGVLVVTAPSTGRYTFGVQIFTPEDNGDYALQASVLP